MAELSEKSFPFDSEEINGEWDREYVADDFARYFRSFISSGVFMRTSSNLQVIANGDMTVTLKPGALMVDGYRYDAENDIVIQLDPADGVLNRIDRISGTWSKADRDIHFTLQKGVPSYEPLPATLRRTAEYKDYVFADIYVAAGAISIKQTDITDQRLNTVVCGLATPFAEFDTTTLYQKIEAYYAEMQARTENWTQEEKEKFTTWFDDIKNQLAGDVAANLQLQIGTLDALKTKNKSNLVAAINEVNEKEVDVLDTREEIQANTTAGKVAGALPVKELYSSLVSDIYVGDDGNLHKVVGGADTVIPFKKLTLADEIDYSNYEYTTNGLDPEVYNKANSKGATLISGGYCIDGDLVHVDIVWQQQGDYVSYVARILGFPIPNKEIPIDSVVQIDQTYSYKYGGKLFTDGSLGMNASNVYARKVHWQFTYRRQSS